MSANNNADELFTLDTESSGREQSRFAILPRPAKHPDFVRYAAPRVSGAVYVHRSAWSQMRELAMSGGRNERIGMLLGRPCTDELGDYTLIMGVEAALPGEYVGTPGFVKISAEGRAAVKARAAQTYMGWEDVGWFHTHPLGAPSFSSTDFDEQGTLLDYQVGIVAATQHFQNGGSDPLGVYLGPVGRRLSGSIPAPLLKPLLPKPPSPPVEQKDELVEPEGRRPRYFTPKMLNRLPVGDATVIAALALTQVALATWVHSAIHSTPAIAAASTAQVAPPRTTIKRVVRTAPGLISEARCMPGQRLTVPVRIPASDRYAVDVSVLDPAAVSATYTAQTSTLAVTCLSAGTSAIEFRDNATGASAGVVIDVSSNTTRQEVP